MDQRSCSVFRSRQTKPHSAEAYRHGAGLSQQAFGDRPDWRDADQYGYLTGLDRAGWAWEWLRRNPDYGATAAVHQEV